MLGGHFRWASGGADDGERARGFLIGADFVGGSVEHGTRRLLTENLLVDFRNFGEVTERFGGVAARAARGGSGLFLSDRSSGGGFLGSCGLRLGLRPPVGRLIQILEARIAFFLAG